MNANTSSPATWPAPTDYSTAHAATPDAAFRPAAVIALLAGLTTAFTVSLVGEMPVGEVILLGVAGWVVLCFSIHHILPGPLLRRRYLGVLLACQGVALLAYVVSDFYRQSLPTDMARGWARMILLGIDVIAVAYLLGRSSHVFLWFLAGQLIGDLVNVLFFDVLFGDVWKFGYGLPVTYAALGLAALAGPTVVLLVAVGLGALHFAMDFRSMGGLCLALAAVTALQMLPRRLRGWALPCSAAVTLVLATLVFGGVRSGDEMEHRASRSDVDRSSMLQAATEAFVASPLIGHGSWFSRSNVYDSFIQIRADRAKEAGVGGFVGPNEEPEAVALHSQLLVTLAEGGIFGASFFFAYAAGLAWALWDQVMVQPWRRERPVRVFMLLLALWHLAMSPFSGAHRVYIALAAGLVLLIQTERHEEDGAVCRHREPGSAGRGEPSSWTASRSAPRTARNGKLHRHEEEPA